jgi:hypothetical protein
MPVLAVWFPATVQRGFQSIYEFGAMRCFAGMRGVFPQENALRGHP